MKNISLLLSAVLLIFVFSAKGQIINTIAGDGAGGYSGDGGPALSAELYGPEGMAFDASGNLYIADQQNRVIRKVSADGTITTFAGKWRDMLDLTFVLGDGGPADSAEFKNPLGVAVDDSGNVYIADPASFRVRKVNTAGVITTFAGIGIQGVSGMGGPADSAELNGPSDVAIDHSGNIYISDVFNVYRVNAAGIINRIAGNDSEGYSGDGGPAILAKMDYPRHIALDDTGNIYIADVFNNVIRKVNIAGIISTIAGNGTIGYSGDFGPATSAQLWEPTGVTMDIAGNLYIADAQNDCVRKVDPSGIITTFAGIGGINGFSGDGGPANLAKLGIPRSLALDAVGNLYISDFDDEDVRRVATALSVSQTTTHEGDYIYPNPSNGFVTIIFPASTERTIITVSDLYGRLLLVKEMPINNDKTVLDLSSLTPGNYIIKIKNSNSCETKKIALE